MPANPSLQPTWNGYVADTKDALILFEAAISGRLSRVVRRPHDRERQNLIRSGSVFIYEESASGIKRWTDGVAWSPSRILNNFLIYRELEKPFPPGEKKRATKKAKRDPRPGEPYPRPMSSEDATGSTSPPTPFSPHTPLVKQQESVADRDAERSLVGSLTDSYQFKEGGLVKKTMSVSVESVHYHLVSYYEPNEVKAGTLSRPSGTDLTYVKVRSELIHRQNFRAPIEDPEETPLQHANYPVQQRAQYVATPQPYMPPAGYMRGPVAPPPNGYYGNWPIQGHPQHPQQPQQPQHPSYAPQSYAQVPQSTGRADGGGYYSHPQPPQNVPRMKQEHGQYPSYQDPRSYPSSDHYGNQMSSWPDNQS